MNYTETTVTTNQPWRATPRGSSSKSQGKLSKSNVSPVGSGATNYGKVVAGTILARDSNGLLHPMGMAKIATAPVASNDLILDNAALFKVGDIIGVRAGQARTKAITNNSVVISIIAKASGLNLIFAVAGTNTALSSSYNPVNKTITINLATDGGGVATTTHATIVSLLMSAYGNLIESASSATPATVGVALSTTALESAKYTGIATTRNVTAIVSNTLTVSGAVITAAIDDIVIKEGAYKPVGILDETVSTTRDVDGTTVAEDREVAVAYEGDARDSSTYLPNLCAGNAGTVTKQALNGHIYVDPGTDPSVAAPTYINPSNELVGFRFRSV